MVNNYKYDEYGNILTSSETISNPFLYAGEVYDKETGLYYLRARYYDPTVGRFLNEDTNEGQINNPLSLNVYSYCFNNPLIFIDSAGNSPSPLGVALGIIGGLVGWQFGDYVAKELGCKGWKYWAVRAAVTVGGAAIGFFAGELVAGIAADYLVANPAIAAQLPGWVLSLVGISTDTGTSEVQILLNKMPELLGSNRDKLLSVIQNNKLWTLVDQLYRPDAHIGDGGTADMLKFEIMNGTSGHLQKAQDYLTALYKLSKSGDLNLFEYDLVEALITDLENAINSIH